LKDEGVITTSAIEASSNETARPPANALEAGDYRLRRPPKIKDVPALVPQPQGILPVPTPE